MTTSTPAYITETETQTFSIEPSSFVQGLITNQGYTDGGNGWVYSNAPLTFNGQLVHGQPGVFGSSQTAVEDLGQAYSVTITPAGPVYTAIPGMDVIFTGTYVVTNVDTTNPNQSEVITTITSPDPNVATTLPFSTVSFLEPFIRVPLGTRLASALMAY